MTEYLGVDNKRALQATSRPLYRINQGDEFILKSGNRSFIIRGTGNSLQVFSIGYLSETKAQNIFGGTINGAVSGKTFNIGYEFDVVDPSSIQMIKI